MDDSTVPGDVVEEAIEFLETINHIYGREEGGLQIAALLMIADRLDGIRSMLTVIAEVELNR